MVVAMGVEIAPQRPDFAVGEAKCPSFPDPRHMRPPKSGA